MLRRESSYLAATVASLTLALLLVACGGSTEESAPVAAPAEPPVAAAAEEPAAAAAEQDGPAVAPADGHDLVAETYLLNAGDFAGKQAADWDNAEVVRVELGEFFFGPDNLTFEAGKPYKVELVNTGDVKHEFTSQDFFAAVAWRKAESAESEVKAAFFTEIEVFAGQQVDLYFVPIKTGTFNLVCEIEGHFEGGMHGVITVTGTTPTSPEPLFVPVEDGPWNQNGADLVAAADWDTMETVEIEEGEYFFGEASFGAEVTVLELGQPYKLVFTNVGEIKHEGTSTEFFNTVAFRKAEDASGEFKAPTPTEVETFAGKETELFLIPTQAGTFELVCEIEGHYDAGMYGTIEVVEAS
jgi:uncharacterized cupredoxin-like copper-binding protein